MKMIKKILLLLGVVLALLIAVILFNTYRAKPWPISTVDTVQFRLPDSAIYHLSAAVQIPTISISDTSGIDTAAFTAFRFFIERSYPLLHQTLSRTIINQFSLVFEWKGQNSSLKPIILMGHYDAVPVEPASLDKWTVAPFSGTITDTVVWGRGSVDDKCGVISILEATEALLRKGFLPKRTIYLCFGHDEEVSGNGAKAMAEYLSQKGVQAEMVLDEGGEIVVEALKEVARPVALIGIGEKGYVSFELSVQKEGGHSSQPAKETAIDILAAGLYRLRSKTPPYRLTPPVKEFMHRIGSSSDIFMNRVASANMWLFEGVTKKVLSSDPGGAAMIQTTIVPTILKSGVKDNLIPAMASAIVNCRILPGETAQTVEDYICRVVSDDRIKIVKIGKFNSDPSAVTDTESAAFKRVESAVYKTVPRVLPSPFLMIGATDSRHFRRLADGVVNFLPMTDSKGYHGINERLPIRDLHRSINFMMVVIEESNQEFK
jgi:carboxypeptidase PM20D1